MNACYSIADRYIERVLVDAVPSSTLYVTQWLTQENRIYCVGYDIHSKTLGKFELDLKTCLVVAVQNVQVLQLLRNCQYIDPGRHMTRLGSACRSNCDKQLWDELHGEPHEPESWQLYSVPTVSFLASKFLHKIIASFHKLMRTPAAWSLELMLTLNIPALPELYCVVLNKDLTYQIQNNLPLEIISFDIETVSHLPQRVPTGDFQSDILFSVSITTKEKQYTFFHFPRDAHLVRRENVQCFDTEVELMTAIFAFFDSLASPFILLGYNSKNYDLTYLAMRAAYLGMPQGDKFGLNSGMIVYGTKMIHIDLMQVIHKYYAGELSSFSLKNVVTQCLNDKSLQKVDLNSVHLRFVYQQILESGLGTGQFPKWGITLDDMIKYNDVDSILVTRLWDNLQYGIFVPDVCRVEHLSLIRLGLTRVQEYISTRFILTCLENGVIFSKYPKTVVGRTYRADIENLTACGDSFAGGFNYRDAMNTYQNVCMMDMLAYYPMMIEGFNISHETVAIVEGITVSKKPSGVRFFKSCSHKGETDAESAILGRQLINGLADNMEEIEMIHQTDRVIVLDGRKPGILSIILAKQNNSRAKIKSVKKSIERCIDAVGSVLLERELDDFEDDDLSDFVPHRFNDQDCKIEILVDFEEWTTKSLESYKQQLVAEQSRCNSVYRNMKIINSSYYGLLGATDGVLSGRHVAAVVTMFGRKFIIETAKCGVLAGYVPILIDTDSVFLAPTTNAKSSQSVINQINQINEKLILNAKTYEHVFVIAKKVYIATCGDKVFSRGINKNGPVLWDEMMFGMFDTFIVKGEPLEASDVITALSTMFTSTFERLQLNKSLVLCQNKRKPEAADYKSNVPMKRLMDKLEREEPGFQLDRNVSYFHIFHHDVQTTEFEIGHRLASTPIHMINLSKFYGKIKKPLFNIMNMAVIRTAKKNRISVMLQETQFTKLFNQAYINSRLGFLKS